MADTTTTGAWQTRVAQAVAPEPDVDEESLTIGLDDAQTAMDAITTKGYVGHAPSEGS